MSSCLANFVLGIYSHSYKAHSLTNDRLSPRAILAKYLAAVNHEDFYANEQTNDRHSVFASQYLAHPWILGQGQGHMVTKCITSRRDSHGTVSLRLSSRNETVPHVRLAARRHNGSGLSYWRQSSGQRQLCTLSSAQPLVYSLLKSLPEAWNEVVKKVILELHTVTHDDNKLAELLL